MSRRSFRSFALPVAPALLLAGCSAPEEPLEPSPAEPLLGGDTVASYAIDDAVGNAPLNTWVRALNAFGAAIPTEATTITVDGVPTEVRFDGTGYAILRTSSPGVVAASTPTDAATIAAYGSEWPGFGANRAFASPLVDATDAVPLTTGAVVVKGTELWWGGPAGRVHRVLNADGPIVGVRAVKVDVDDVTDVVAWTDYSVFLLRGRGSGGLSWGGGLTAPGYTVAGADVADLNVDNLPDLAIAWASTDSSKLDVWNGDGLFGFTPAEPRNLAAMPMDLSIGDNTDEGKNQITVLDVDGGWTRFIAGNDVQYMPIGPNAPSEIVIQLDSTVEGAGDINGDRADDVWIYAPRADNATRGVYLLDLKGQHVGILDYKTSSGYLTRGDGDGDEVIDLFSNQDDLQLYSLAYDLTSTDSYTPRRLEDMPEHAPIGVTDWLDGDGIIDLFLAGDELWWWWRGANAPEDFNVFWEIREPTTWQATASVGRSAVLELDGDPTTFEVVIFEIDGLETRIEVRQGTPGGGGLTGIGNTLISSNGVSPIDVAVCDGFAWVLLSGELVRVDLTDPSSPKKKNTLSTIASRVDCGAAPDGAVAAILSDGTIQLLSAGVAEIGTITVTGAQDLAIGDAGFGPEVRTCNDPDCTIGFWPWGAAGEGSFVTAAGGQIGADAGSTVPGSGEMSFYDVDADGNLDLLAAAEDGVVTVLRSSGSAPGMLPEYYHFRSPLRGPVSVADADGDGHNDVWLLDEDGLVRHTIAPWVPLVTVPGDTGVTGDTGAPDTAAPDTGAADTGSTTDTAGGTGTGP